MLKRITIKNFRSLKDVTIDLQDVNLFIGPNNSGKTNFLKALEFLGDYFNHKLINRDIRDYTFQKNDTESHPIFFLLEFEKVNGFNEQHSLYLIFEFFNLGEWFANPARPILMKNNEFFGIAKRNWQAPANFALSNVEELDNIFNYYMLNWRNTKINLPAAFNKNTGQRYSSGSFHKDAKNHKDANATHRMSAVLSPTDLFGIGSPAANLINPLNLKDFISNCSIYSPDVVKIRLPNPVGLATYKIEKDASNLTSFLDDLLRRYKKVYQGLEKDLNTCVSDFTSIISKNIEFIDHSDDEEIKIGTLLGLHDRFDKEYWADDLSDGVLYFLALLAIIHQPNPPKLLLLEEPEKGIHPKRISEIIDFILQLVETRGIQVILTTHSTQVLDEFKDLTEGVFVFEKEGPETKIKNLQKDIIEPTNKDLKKKKLPLISYRDGLGEHWAMGFIGGVPK